MKIAIKKNHYMKLLYFFCLFIFSISSFSQINEYDEPYYSTPTQTYDNSRHNDLVQENLILKQKIHETFSIRCRNYYESCDYLISLVTIDNKNNEKIIDIFREHQRHLSWFFNKNMYLYRNEFLKLEKDIHYDTSLYFTTE